MEPIQDIKRLEGWVTFPEAAELLGMSKQGMHRLVWEDGVFYPETDIRAVGNRPLFLLRREAVERVVADRAQQALKRAAIKKLS